MRSWLPFALVLAFCLGAPLGALSLRGVHGDAPVAETPPAVDFCERYDWYGDGRCDEFCGEADPDCAPPEVPVVCASDDLMSRSL